MVLKLCFPLNISIQLSRLAHAPFPSLRICLDPKKKTPCNKKIVDTSEPRRISKDIHTGIDNLFVPEVYRQENVVCPGWPEDILDMCGGGKHQYSLSGLPNNSGDGGGELCKQPFF